MIFLNGNGNRYNRLSFFGVFQTAIGFFISLLVYVFPSSLPVEKSNCCKEKNGLKVSMWWPCGNRKTSHDFWELCTKKLDTTIRLCLIYVDDFRRLLCRRLCYNSGFLSYALSLSAGYIPWQLYFVKKSAIEPQKWCQCRISVSTCHTTRNWPSTCVLYVEKLVSVVGNVTVVWLWIEYWLLAQGRLSKWSNTVAPEAIKDKISLLKATKD